MNIKEIQKEYLPKIDAIVHDSFSKYLNPTMEEMVSYHYDTGGKRLRPLSVILAAKTIKPTIEDASLLSFAAAVELIHNATLIHDDIQDGDIVRRGKPTLWKKYSLAQGINCGDILFFLAEKMIHDIDSSETKIANLKLDLLKLITEKTMRVIEGQSLEFFLKDRLEIPSQNDYEQMVIGKTSALFSLPLLGGAILAEASANTVAELETASNLLGLLFQIRDDYIDLWGEKGRGQRGCDIAEGKISYPALLGCEMLDNDERKQFLEILKCDREKTSQTDIETAIALLEKANVKNAVEEKMAKIKNEILKTTIHEEVAVILKPILEILS